jgi:hypothetical protein
MKMSVTHTSKGMFECIFGGLKSAFNIKKFHLKQKSTRLIKKKTESIFTGPKSLKNTKTHF